MPGLTFDTGGLIALDRNDRRVIVLLARAARPARRSPFRPLPSLRRSVDRSDRCGWHG
jgi:hypothetical protein